MSLSKQEFQNQQQHEAVAAERAAAKQAEIAADLARLADEGSANLTDIERLQKQQASLGEDIEILRRREQEGVNYF